MCSGRCLLKLGLAGLVLLLPNSFSGTDLKILDIHSIGPANTFRLSWSTVVSNTYQLQRTATLNNSTSWVPLITLQATGTVATADDSAGSGAGQRFYRVIQLANVGGDTQPPFVAFADATMATASDGSSGIRLNFVAGDNVGVSSVTVKEGTNTLGTATSLGGSNWTFLVSANIAQIQGRFFVAVARDPAGNQGQSTPVGLMAVDPDIFTPLDSNGQPTGKRPLTASSATQSGPFIYHPGGRPRPGAAPDFFLRFPDGASIQQVNGGMTLQFVRVSAGFETNSPFALATPLQRDTGGTKQLTIGPLLFSDLSGMFGVDATNGLPLVAFGLFSLNWRGGQLDDRGLVGAQFQFAIPNLPLPTWSLQLGNLLTEFATERTLRVPLSGTFSLPDGSADGAQLQIGDGSPLWLTLRSDGRTSLEGPVQLQWPNGANVRAEMKFDDPEYCLALRMSGLHVQALSNLVDLLPSNPTSCVPATASAAQLTQASRCLDSFAHAYGHFSAAIAASASNAPVSAAAPPDYLNLASEALEAWGYSAVAGTVQALPLDAIAPLVTQVGNEAASNDELADAMIYRHALLRARAAEQTNALTGSVGSRAQLDLALFEAENAALLRASDAETTLSLETVKEIAKDLVEAEALRQTANLPAGPLVTNALPNLFRSFSERLANSYGVQTNVFVPDNNPKVNTLNRFVAIEQLQQVFDLLANAALTGTDLNSTRLDELAGQLGVQLFRTINTNLNTAEATNDLPGFILAGQDLVELAGWVQDGAFPNVPALASLDDGSALASLGNRLNNLLAAELDRPFGSKTLGRQAAEIRALLGVLRGVPGTVTFAAPPIRRAYDKLEEQLNLAVSPAALAAETNTLNLVDLVEAGTLHRELGARFGFPQTVNWETNRLPQVAQRLGALAISVGGWRELDQAVRLLLNAADRANLVNDQNLRRAYLFQAALLLDNARTVARGLMQNASGLLRVLDFALPGDIIIDQPAGYACYNRLSGNLHGALRGSVRLPKYNLLLTVPNASFDSGGRFDLSTFGTLGIPGGQLTIPPRRPLHLGFSPSRGFSLQGDARLTLTDGLRLDATISLVDPHYCFGLSARGLDFNLGRELVLQRPTLSESALNTFGDGLRDIAGDYVRSLGNSLETIASAVTNFPPVDETGFGRSPEFVTPEITLPFSGLNTWANEVLAHVRSGLTNIVLDLKPVMEMADQMNTEARAATNALADEQGFLLSLAQRQQIRLKASQAAASAAAAGSNQQDINQLNTILAQGAQLEASNIVALVNTNLTSDFARASDVVRLLLNSAAVFQNFGLEITNGAKVTYSNSCLLMISTNVELADRAEALTLCTAQGQAGQFGIDPITGNVINSNLFNAAALDDLDRVAKTLVDIEVDLATFGSDNQGSLFPSLQQMLSREFTLLQIQIQNFDELPLKIQDAWRLVDVAKALEFVGATNINPGALSALLDAQLAAQMIDPATLDQAKAVARENERLRQYALRSEVARILGRDRRIQLIAPDEDYQPDFLTQLNTYFRVLGMPLPPGIGTNVDAYVRFKAAQLRAQPFTPEFLTNQLNNARTLLSVVLGLTDVAGTRLTNDLVTLTNLQFAISNLTLSFTNATEINRDWWLAGRYQEALRLHAAIYGTNISSGFSNALNNARNATLLATDRMVSNVANIFNSIQYQDVIIPLPGRADITKVFGNICYDRTVGQLSGCFGGRVEFPDLGSNVFFEVSQACLNTDGSYQIAANTAAPLPFGRAALSSSLNVSGNSSGLAFFSGLGTLTVPNGSAGNRIFTVSNFFDQVQHKLSFDAQGNNLDLRFGDDFAVFNAGFGFDLSTVSPQGAFRANGSAGILARQHPLPVSLNRTNFQLVADNVAAAFTYSSNAFALSLTNGTLTLPSIFHAGACPTNAGQPSGPQIGLVPGTPITVNVGIGTNPAVGFSGGLAFQNLGFAVPGLTNLTVEVCSAQLLFQSNAVPYLTNLQATVTLPLPGSPQIAIIDVTNGAWAVNGFPLGTLTLRSNLTLLNTSGFRFTLPGANDATCGNGTSLTVSNDAQGVFFLLNGGARFEVPASVIGDDSGGALSFTTCGSFSGGQNRAPQMAINTLAFNGTFRLGGTGGLRIENAQLAVNGLQNVFSPSVASPWSVALGGIVNIPNGPQLGVSNLRFVFEGNPVPRIDPGSFSLASTNGLIPVPGMPFNVTAASLTFKNGALGFPQILAPSNLKITLSATMDLPPGSNPLVSGQVNDLSLEMKNGLPTASLNGIGISFQGLEFPPIAIGGQVYIGGLNALGQGTIDDIFFAGKVGGTLNDVGIRGLFAFNMHGLIGYCLDVNAGPAGIPLDGGALGGFLLTGASGGVSFQSGNGDPCNFSTYYPVGSDGRPISNDQLPPSILTNRIGAQRTWDAHRDQVARDHARKQLANDAAAAARATSLTNPPPPPPQGGTNPVVNVPTFPCPGGDCPPPTINILCQPHPDTNQFPNRVIIKFTALDESRLNDFGITRAFIQGLGASTAQQIADTISGMVSSRVSLLIPRADPGIFTQTFADQLNQQITNDLTQLQTGLDGIILNAVSGVLGNSDNVYDAIKAAAYGGVPCPDVTIKLTGTFSHAAVSTVLSATAGVTLSSSGSAGVVGTLNAMGVPVGRIEEFIAVTDSRGNPNPSLCGETVFAIGPIDLGRVDLKMACDGCMTSMLGSFGSLVTCAGDAQTLAVLARVKPSVTNLPIPQAISTLTNSEKAAFIATLFSQPPVPGLYDCFLGSASNAVLNFSPSFQICGEVKPKLFGFSLSPSAVSFNAGATRSNLAGSVTFSPSYIIENTLLCAGAPTCIPLFPGVDQATLGFAMGIPDPAPIFLGGLRGDFSSPQSLSNVASNGFQTFLANATITVGYDLAPLGLKLASAQGRVVMPNLVQHPARPGNVYIPPEDRGITNLPSRVDVLIQALSIDFLKNPLWKGDVNDLPTIYPSGSAQRTALQGMSFNVDYFPYGGLLGAGQLNLPKIIYDAPPPELGMVLNGTNLLQQLGAASTLITDYILTTTNVGSLGFYVPAPNPPFFTDTNGQPLSPIQMLNAIKSFDGTAAAFTNLYSPQFAFFRGFVNGQLLGIPVANAQLDMVPAGNNSHFLLHAAIPTNSWLKSFIDSAVFDFQMRGSPTQSIDFFFSNLLAQVQIAVQTNDPAVQQQALISAQNSVDAALPKISLDFQVNNFRVPDAISNVLAAGASARVVAYSPRFNPSFAGNGALADITRNGGIAFQGQFNFANYVSIPNAELALALRPLALPALYGSFDVASLNIPGLPLNNAHFDFNSDPDIGENYLAASGSLNPISFNPLGGQPLLTIRNLTNAGAQISASFSLSRPTNGLPLPAFLISPSAIDMPLLGTNLSVRIHGATTNDPFGFSSTAPWTNNVTISGTLSIRDPLNLNSEIVRISGAGQPFAAQLSGNGMQMSQLTVTLPSSVTIVAFPGTSSQQTFTFSSGGCPNLLSISGNGNLVLSGGLGGSLDLSAYGLGTISGGACFGLTNSQLTINGTIGGGALTNGGANFTISGTMLAGFSGVSLSGNASIAPIQIGAFVLSGGSGSNLVASITNGGLMLTSGAKLKLQATGYPANDLFTLSPFLISGNGNFNVLATSGNLDLPGFFSMSSGTYILSRSNNVASLDVSSPNFQLFSGKPYVTSVNPLIQHLFVDSTGHFYADTSNQVVNLPAAFVARGRLEIGYEPSPNKPAIGVSASPLGFGTVNYGSSSNIVLNVTNNGQAPLLATLSSSVPAAFTVNPFSLNLDPTEVAHVSVRFTPPAAGPNIGALSLLHNGTNPSPVSILMSGTGGSVPILRLSATNLDFGSIKLNEQATLGLRVDNFGITNLVITNSILSGPFSVTPATAIIGPGTNTVLNVVFNANAIANLSGTLQIKSNDPNGTRNVALAGTGFVIRWVNQREGGERFSSIAADGNDRAFVVGSPGSVLVTDNGGHGWGLPDTIVNARLAGAAMASNGLTGWVVGDAGKAFKTTDGGKTWAQLTQSVIDNPAHYWGAAIEQPGTGRAAFAGHLEVCQTNIINGQPIVVCHENGLVAVQTGATTFVTNEFGFASMDALSWANVGTEIIGLAGSQFLGGLYRSTNSGASWDQVTSYSPGVSGGILSLAMNSSGTGLLVSDHGSVYRSTDKGLNWTQVLASPQTLRCVAIDGLTAYAGGSGGTLLRSVSPFTTWTQESIDAPTIYSIAARSNAVWVAGDKGNIQFRPVAPPAGPYLAYQPGSLDYGFVASQDSFPKVLTLLNRGISNLVVTNITIQGSVSNQFIVTGTYPMTIAPDSAQQINIFFNPTAVTNVNTTVLMRSSDPDGALSGPVRAQSSTTGWVLKPPLSPGSTNESAMAIQMLTDTFGYGLTTADLYKTTNGGASWIKLNVNPPGLPRAMFFVTTNAGWIVGGNSTFSINQGNGFIRKTVNSGATWTSQFFTNTDNPFASISMASSNVGYATTFSYRACPICTFVAGTVYTTVNSGATWTQVTAPSSSFGGNGALETISTAELFVGDGSFLRRSADSGSTWTTVITNSGAMSSVFFADTQHGWAVGAGGTYWKTTLGGDTAAEWTQQTAFTSDTLNQIQFASTSIGWAVPNAVAAQAEIFRSDDGGTTWRDELSESSLGGPPNLIPLVIAGRNGTNAVALGTSGSVRRIEQFTNELIGITVAQPVLNFGRPVVGFPVTNALNVRNLGDATLTISDILIDGISRTNLGFHVNNTLPIVLLQNGSTLLNVVAENTIPGTNSLTLSIISDGALQSLPVQLRSVVVPQPEVIVFKTDPPGMPLKIDGTNITAPAAYTVTDTANGPGQWDVGSAHTIEAVASNTVNGQVYSFSSWQPAGDRIFSYTVTNVSETFTGRYLASSDTAGSGGGLGAALLQPTGKIRQPLILSGSGNPNGPFLRLTQASISNSVFGSFLVSGTVFLSADNIEATLSNRPIRLPQSNNVPALLDIGAGSWKFLLATQNVSLNAQTPSILVFSNQVNPPSSLALNLNLSNTSFNAAFSLPQGAIIARDFLEMGPSAATLSFSTSFSLSVTGEVRALRKPGATDWAFKTNFNMAFRDGPFTNSFALPASILRLTVPFTTNEIFEARGGVNSRLDLRRDVTGAFSLSLSNLAVDILNQPLTTFSGSANSSGLITLSATPSTNTPFELGPFRWHTANSSSFSWNVKNGALSFTLGGGTLTDDGSGSVPGWPSSGLVLPTINFDSNGDFDTTVTLGGFNFNGIGLGKATETSDRFVRFRRTAGALKLSLRDRQNFFDSTMGLGFDIDSTGNAAGFFNGSFGTDFGGSIGYVNFGRVDLSYDSTPVEPSYQFRGKVRVAGNDFRVKFGSNGGETCHLICDPNNCIETLCFTFQP